MKYIFKGQRGSLLMVSVIALVVLSIMGLAFLSRSNTDLKASSNVKRKTAGYFAAESAVEMVVKNIKEHVETYGVQRFYYEPSVDDPESGFDLPEIPFTVDPITYPNEYVQECAMYIFSNNPGDWEDNFFYNLAWTCGYYYFKNAIFPRGFQNVNPDYNIDLVSMGKMDSNDETKTLEDKFRMPNYLNSMNYTGLNVARRIYSFIVRATSVKDLTKTTLEATVSVNTIPLFQWLFLSDGTITLMPGSHYVVNGRLHSNTDIRAATMGGPIDFIPNDFDSGTKALTATGNIWRVFKANNYTYAPGGDVRVEAEDSSWGRFQDNLQYDISGGWPSAGDCGDRNDPECWRDASSGSYTYYSIKVNPDAAEFGGRLFSENLYGEDAEGHTIYPPTYRALKEEDMEDSNNAQRRVIEPGYSNVNGIPYNFENTKFQKWYKTNLKVMRGDDGVLRSIDNNGNEIVAGPLSFDYLRTQGIITYDTTNDFYLPTAGRIARTITVDIDKFKNDSQLKNYSIKHVYVGSMQEARGEVHYPDPACNPDHSNGGVNSEICLDSDGNDCTQACPAPPAPCVQRCNPDETGEMDIVMLKNGASLPTEGLTVSTNLVTFIQGDYNTDKVFTDQEGNKTEAPAAVNCDMLGFLSNSWDPSSWDASSGWQPNDPKGPPTATETTYNLAYMMGLGMNSGMEHPLIESWGGSKINRNISAIALWKSDNFPPKAGGTVVNNWYLRAWKFFYSPAKWITNQIKGYGINPPPGADHDVKVILQSVREIQDLNV